MLNVLLAHGALGAILGAGSRVTVLFLPSIAAIIEGAVISRALGFSGFEGCVLSIALLTCIQAGYILGSMAGAMKATTG